MSPKQTAFENLANNMIERMKKRNMEGYYCATGEEATKKALSLMPEGSSISWGGSMSISECGLMDAIQNKNYELIDRALASTPEEKRAIYGKIVCSDYYLMSANAITLSGELVNIDGFGNRVACLCAGPEHVIVIVGRNKIETDVDSAMKRVRNVAAPANTVRLNKSTPCTKTGKCEDCFSPDCICSQFVVTRRSGIPGRIKVILVGEELGY